MQTFRTSLQDHIMIYIYLSVTCLYFKRECTSLVSIFNNLPTDLKQTSHNIYKFQKALKKSFSTTPFIHLRSIITGKKMSLVINNCKHYLIKILNFIFIVSYVIYLEPLIIKCGKRIPIYVYLEYNDILYTLHIQVKMLHLLTVYAHMLSTFNQLNWNQSIPITITKLCNWIISLEHTSPTWICTEW